MNELPDLLQAVEASIRSVKYTLGIAQKVHPPSHRADMIRSQLEASLEILEKAKNFGTAGGSGFHMAVTQETKP